MEKSKVLVIVDGHAILHRAYHALPVMTSPVGKPINAVYGFVSMLIRVIEELKATHLTVAFDRPGKTFRNDLLTDYQAQRPKLDDSLSVQIPVIHDVVSAFHFPIFEYDGFEADDVIATIAHQVTAEDKNVEVIIVTGDRDLLQLVDKQISLFMPLKGLSDAKIFREAETVERMGVSPNHIVDLKTLIGDASDNYTGVPGVGPKTAKTLLEQFGSVDNLLKKTSEIKNERIRKMIETNIDHILTTQKIAQVVDSVPITFDLNKSKIPEDLLTPEIISLFGELQFRTLFKRLSNLSKISQTKKKESMAKDVDSSQIKMFQ